MTMAEFERVLDRQCVREMRLLGNGDDDAVEAFWRESTERLRRDAYAAPEDVAVWLVRVATPRESGRERRRGLSRLLPDGRDSDDLVPVYNGGDRDGGDGDGNDDATIFRAVLAGREADALAAKAASYRGGGVVTTTPLPPACRVASGAPEAAAPFDRDDRDPGPAVVRADVAPTDDDDDAVRRLADDLLRRCAARSRDEIEALLRDVFPYVWSSLVVDLTDASIAWHDVVDVVASGRSRLTLSVRRDDAETDVLRRAEILSLVACLATDGRVAHVELQRRIALPDGRRSDANGNDDDDASEGGSPGFFLNHRDQDYHDNNLLSEGGGSSSSGGGATLQTMDRNRKRKKKSAKRQRRTRRRRTREKEKPAYKAWEEM